MLRAEAMWTVFQPSSCSWAVVIIRLWNLWTTWAGTTRARAAFCAWTVASGTANSTARSGRCQWRARDEPSRSEVRTFVAFPVKSFCSVFCRRGLTSDCRRELY